MTTLERSHDETPAQWAVRWFAVVAIAALCVSVPLAHVLWHGLLGHDAAPIRTRSQVAAPQVTAKNLADGTWMAAKERELREASPIVWRLRGGWSELCYEFGVPQSRQLHFGSDEWLFLPSSIRPYREGYERATPARRALFAEVRDLVRASGAELFVVVVPDKARIYPDRAWPDGVVPPQKADLYDGMLAELRELDIATVDLVAPLRAHRASPVPGVPPGELYFARDTHWRAPGALLAGYTIAGAIEQRFGERLGPRREMQITGPNTARFCGDLTMQLGLLACIVPDPVIGQRPVALSLLTDRLAEQRDYYGLTMRIDGRNVPMDGADPEAEVLLIGTSFSEENGREALSLALGRPVRSYIVRGPEGMLPLQAALPELRRGTRAKVVVWEFVERGQFQGPWLAPKL